jgi:hypothetical protein
VQVIALLALTLLPFGFDRPSELGLDFNSFLAGALIYLMALVLGVGVSIAMKRWWFAAMQMAVAVVVPAVFFWNLLFLPANQPPTAPAEQRSAID